ncbi:hypothetical protein IG631_22493 [Alternaria alternata]|nr:hypothetical protein IG631_22493 [Alternaria alternata]
MVAITKCCRLPRLGRLSVSISNSVSVNIGKHRCLQNPSPQGIAYALSHCDHSHATSLPLASLRPYVAVRSTVPRTHGQISRDVTVLFRLVAALLCYQHRSYASWTARDGIPRVAGPRKAWCLDQRARTGSLCRGQELDTDTMQGKHLQLCP